MSLVSALFEFAHDAGAISKTAKAQTLLVPVLAVSDVGTCFECTMATTAARAVLAVSEAGI